MHGLIFFYIGKFAERFPAALSTQSGSRAAAASQAGPRYTPSGVYPDAEAMALLADLATAAGRPLADLEVEFGEFLAPHLMRTATAFVEPGWRTLDVIEHTEAIIHRMIRANSPGAAPPVLEVFRSAPDELQLVYSSRRKLCGLAKGIMRGLAAHFQERVSVDEQSCMLRGDAFCSFVIRRDLTDTHPTHSALTATLTTDLGSDAEDKTLPVVEDPPPSMIGNYRVLGLIGSGAMGRVYLAHDAVLDRRVAIKVMSARYAGNQIARQRFLRESRSVGAIEHPHVMTIHQVGEQGGLPYIVMQFLEGRTLRDYRDRTGPLPFDEALRYGREIAAGLAAAHRRGIVHRDVKPANVFLEGEARSVRIIDFGLARDVDAQGSAITCDGALIGTPAYMPPEGIEGAEIDARGDLFGLGVILYELLADQLPFSGRSVAAVLAAITKGQPRPLHEAAPSVPREVSDLVMRLIAHDKADRPADATAVAAELAALERQFAGSDRG